MKNDVVEKIKDKGMFDFDRDEEYNREQQKNLSELQMSMEGKYIDLKEECEEIERNLLLLERVQEGRNKAQREALLEVAKVEEGHQEKFNKLRDVKHYLACIGEIKEHNKMLVELRNLNL